MKARAAQATTIVLFGDPAGRLALDPVALGAVAHHPHPRLRRRPGRGHHRRHRGPATRRASRP
jgi:hypothetical protein